LPVQRGNVSLSNLQVVNAILHVAEDGCQWRGLPKRFGTWRTICTRMNRWAKAGVHGRFCEGMQHQRLIRVKIESVSLDGTGALTQTAPSGRQVPCRMERQSSYGWRRCSARHRVLADRRAGGRRAGRRRPAADPCRSVPPAAAWSWSARKEAMKPGNSPSISASFQSSRRSQRALSPGSTARLGTAAEARSSGWFVGSRACAAFSTASTSSTPCQCEQFLGGGGVYSGAGRYFLPQ